MNRTLNLVAAEIGMSAEELTVWVERRWVLPSRSGTSLTFDDTDRARIRMILEFHRDLAIDEEAMPVVLDLLDRLHAARAQLRAVLEGVAELSETSKDTLMQRLMKEPKS